ncbi:MAG: sigma-70 family RNA polymerase sigma factor [Bacteroidia bacterium]|nr:sigma-70 family RNA polymerase sigma factor [Bacteroidia bacterium]
MKQAKVKPTPYAQTYRVEGFNNEALIWMDFCKGSQNAFKTIYQKYFNLLFNYCLKFTADRSLIQDCIQDLFITIHKNHSNLGPTNSIKNYLFISIRRKLLRYLQKENKFIYKDKVHWECLLYDVPIEYELVEEQEKKQNLARLKYLLEKLPRRQKQALYYYYYENFSYQEVAEIMEMTNIKSARNLIYKGISSLREGF